MDLAPGPALGALAALGAAAAWAVTSLLVRTLAPVLGSVAINAFRSAAAGTLLLAWLLATEGPGPLLGMSLTALGLLAGSIVLAIGIGDTVFFESTRSLGLGRAMTVAMSYPLVAVALAWAVLGEAITLRVAAGSLLTLGGVALIVLARGGDAGRTEHFWLGVAAALLAAVAWGASVVLLRPALREVDATAAQAVRLPLAGLLLGVTPWSRGTVRRVLDADGPARWRLAWLVGITSVSSVMFVASVKYTDVAVATVLSSTAPLFAIVLGVVFLGERLTAGAMLGAAVTVAGIVVLRL